MNDLEKAFKSAYGKCMAVASDNEIEYFFEYKEKIQLINDFKEAEFIRSGAMYWGHIEDAWLLWNEAIDYSKKENS